MLDMCFAAGVFKKPVLILLLPFFCFFYTNFFPKNLFLNFKICFKKSKIFRVKKKKNCWCKKYPLFYGFDLRQSCFLQLFITSLVGPVQPSSPIVPSLQLLVRVFVPPPHVTEHGGFDHDVHLAKMERFFIWIKGRTI